MKIIDLKVGDKLWGYNYPDNVYEVIKVRNFSIYLAITTSSLQDIVCLSPCNTATIEEYGYFTTREEVLDYRIKQAKYALQHEISCKNKGF